MRYYKTELYHHRVTREGQLVGLLGDIIIDFATGKIISIRVRGSYIPAENVISWYPIELAKNAKKLVYKKRPKALRSQRVVDQSGKTIGVVADFQIDTDALILTQIVVKPKNLLIRLMTKQERLFDYAHIKDISSKKITVYDDNLLVKETVWA